MPRTKTEKIIEKPEKVEEPERLQAPVGAVVVDDRVEFQLRETIVKTGTKQAYFIDRPLKTPVGWTIGQMVNSLGVGGRVYVAPVMDDQVREALESRFGKGRKEDELIVYGGEEEVVEPEPEVRRTLSKRSGPEVVGAEAEE